MPARASRLGWFVVAIALALSPIAGCKRQEKKPAPAPPPPAAGATGATGAADPFAGRKAPTARIAELQAELDQDPKNAAKWVELGNLHYDVRDREDAVRAYGRALELRPDDVNVITDQGVMYRELGEHEKAVANFQRARKIDPKHVQAAYNLGVMQAQLGNRDEAIQAFEDVVELDGNGAAGASAKKLIESLKTQQPAKAAPAAPTKS